MNSILVVDDDAGIRDSLSKLLVLAGFEVSTARGGREAHRLIRQSDVHVLITDLIMEDVDGLTLIREVRASHPATKIIAISGGGQGSAEAILSAARRLGADSSFTKPVPPADLLQLLRTFTYPEN